MFRVLAGTLVTLVVLHGAAIAKAKCEIEAREIFKPQKKVVAMVSGLNTSPGSNFVLFQSNLRVNTDGAPNSYHPYDLKGEYKAINNIANGVSIIKDGHVAKYPEIIKIFSDFRDNNWVAPESYKIVWKNVLAAKKDGNRSVPCIFATGDHKGYFGSLTALKNGLSESDGGECQAANQLDERFIPALVIAGGDNPLKHFKVHIGDLVVVANPQNGVVEGAVIGDSGPEDNLGEGSVALNMAMLQKTPQPTNYAEAKKLDTGSARMVVAIIAGSASYELKRPYSQKNISQRVQSWLSAHQYGSLSDFGVAIKECAEQL